MFGDRLADYVDHGGNVVLCLWSNNYGWGNSPAGRFTTYHPFALQGYRTLPIQCDTVDICMKYHPIVRDMNPLEYTARYTIQGDVQKGRRVDIEVVGKWTNAKTNMIGIRYDKRGLIISIGCVCSESYMKGDIYPLLKNVVRYRKYRGRGKKH